MESRFLLNHKCESASRSRYFRVEWPLSFTFRPETLKKLNTWKSSRHGFLGKANGSKLTLRWENSPDLNKFWLWSSPNAQGIQTESLFLCLNVQREPLLSKQSLTRSRSHLCSFSTRGNYSIEIKLCFCTAETRLSTSFSFMIVSNPFWKSSSWWKADPWACESINDTSFRSKDDNNLWEALWIK